MAPVPYPSGCPKLIPRRALLLAALGSLSACTLVDQRTFDADAGKRPVFAAPPAPPAPPPPEPGPPPLFVVRLPLPGDLRAQIAPSVAAAKARKAGVIFDVVELTQSDSMTVGAEAERVARAIAAEGVPAARVRLAVRQLANAPREVRVYVR